MYRVFKRTGKSFAEGQEVLGEFDTFDLAYAKGLEVCSDLFNEPNKESEDYWFSDESDPNTGYKVHIQRN